MAASRSRKGSFWEIRLQRRLVYKDKEFTSPNKIYHFINCTNKVPKTGKSKRKRVYNLQWPESDIGRIEQVFSDMLEPIQKFIEEAEMMYESVLIYCNNGQNRSLVIMVCYIMNRFRWSFKKTLAFLSSKRPSLIIRHNYFQALQDAANSFSRSIVLSNNWQNDFQSPIEYREEEVLLTNTYFNSQKMRVETEFACMISRQLKNRSYEKKTKRSVQWADRLRKEKVKVKAKSTQKTGKSNPMKGKTIKPVDNLKTKCRLNNIKTELDDSYEDTYAKRIAEKNKFQLSSSSEFYQKNMREIQMKILNNQVQEKSGRNAINNSFSKSTNIQEDLSNVDKNETNESKSGVFKILKDGVKGNRRPKQFKDSFLKDFKFLKVNRAENPETEPEIDKTTYRSSKPSKTNRYEDSNVINRNLDQLMKEKKFKTRALKFDMSKIEAEQAVKKNDSVNNPKSLTNISKFENMQFDSKTDNNYIKTKIIMKHLLEQKNPSFNTSIEPDKQKPLLKSNKNSEVFFDKNGEASKRPSSAPNKG